MEIKTIFSMTEVHKKLFSLIQFILMKIHNLEMKLIKLYKPTHEHSNSNGDDIHP